MRDFIVSMLLSMVIYSFIFRVCFKRKSIFLVIIALIIMLLISLEMYSNISYILFNALIIFISMIIGFYSKRVK